jgi:ubiquitin-conjugating enzyme E2 A
MAVPGASAMLRLQSDLRAISTDPPDGCSASPNESDLFVWTASVFGPSDSPWEGGVFSLRLTFSEQYPNRPPKVRFTGPMFHPNVYQDGTLCLDTIQDQWSPCQSVSTLLTSVQSLLTDPNCSSPANAEAARLFQSDMREYNRRVKTLAQRSIEYAWG